MTARTRAVAAVVGVAVLVLLAVVLGRTGLLGTSAGPPSTRASAVGSPSPGSSVGRDPDSGLAYIELTGLPAEAQLTVRRIDTGGPFPYAKDGAVFENRQHLLPRQATGYYREYTVPTPGSADRGARRVVAGDQGRQLFYTADHYLTFARIRR